MPSPQTRTGQPKLSDVARHVCQPEAITSTGWPAVRDRARAMGIPFDRWQDGVGRLALSKRADGQYAAGVGGVIMSIPRQVGKTYLIGWMMFALCSLHPNLTVIWTAHHSRTSDETFTKMQSMARNPKAAVYLDGPPRAANGQQLVRFKNGSRILFGARSQGFGLGFDEVDVLVLDEAQRVKESAMLDMAPATNAAPNGLIFMMGTPPRPNDDGEAFSNRRNDALAGDPDTAYVEFSADREAKIIDWKQVGKANPSYPHRTSKHAVERMRKMITSDDGFIREAYGIWDEVKAGKKAIDTGKWNATKIPPSSVPDEGVKSFAVKFSPDGARVALSVALKPKDGPVHVEGIRVANMGEGTQWLVDFLVERHREAAQIVIDGKFGTGFLVNALRDAGVKNKNQVLMPTFDQVKSAHSMFLQAVQSGGVSMIVQDELDAEARDAEFRELGKDGGFGWSAPEGGSVLLLETVTFAFWAAKTTKRKPSHQSVVEVF